MNDIAYYAERITVFEKRKIGRSPQGNPVFKNTVVNYHVQGLYAYKVQNYFINGKIQENTSKSVHLKTLFKHIKHVYDFNHVLIARRIDPGQPLRVTGKGMSKFLEKS
ncbi:MULTISPECIES: type IV conjugative transfer system protein TraE [Enterococcus]|uniref:type IV conjugative transfer system protein TraE n=1 Tax=Enterococcus TaxID=1350 RepID=UPI00289117A8|nr:MULTISPECIES: type IV conjugative transfer system protein TraE [Enterococcus]MDT2614465.1 type IV conjugative transfer system protein TraE [Enterococcus dongliensis]MDT2670027.1 type IV conjugative transfer system protein TraE [Enterococcus dongliensis]